MIAKDFNSNTQHLLDLISEILISKQEEYAEGGEQGDRLFNFKQATSLLNTNQARVCLMYATKHFASLAKISEDMDKGVYPSREILEEKCKDAAAYCMLLYSCILEEIDKHKSE